MANIIEYNAPIRPLQVSESGDQALAREGLHAEAVSQRSGAELGAAIGHLTEDTIRANQEHEDATQISQALATSTHLAADLSQKWKDFANNADPHDPTVAQRFQDQVVEPALDQASGRFTTPRSQRVWMEARNRLEEHFNETNAADMGHLAGIAAMADYHAILNNLGALVAQDPTRLAYAKQELQTSTKEIADSGKNLTPEARAKFLSETVESGLEQIERMAFTSTALKNPDHAEQLLNSGEYPNMNPADSRQALTQIKSLKKQDATNAMAQQRFREEEADRQAGQKYTSMFADPNTDKSQLNMRIWTDPNLNIHSKLALQERLNSPTLPMNAGANADLYRRILLPESDPQRISSPDQLYAMAAKQQLSDQQVNHFLSILRPDTPERMSVAKAWQGANEVAQGIFTPRLANAGGLFQDVLGPANKQAMAEFTNQLQLEISQKLDERTMSPSAYATALHALLDTSSKDNIVQPLIHSILDKYSKLPGTVFGDTGALDIGRLPIVTPNAPLDLDWVPFKGNIVKPGETAPPSSAEVKAKGLAQEELDRIRKENGEQ